MRPPTSRTPPSPLLRAAALALVAATAALALASGCSLIHAEADCEAGCKQLDMCGLLTPGSCGAYCASLATSVGLAGCTDEFDAQNTCGQGLTDCKNATMCTKAVQAFADCMMSYCKQNPHGSGCP